MMDLTEGLVGACVAALGGGMQRPFGEKFVELPRPGGASYAELVPTEHDGAAIETRPRFSLPPSHGRAGRRQASRRDRPQSLQREGGRNLAGPVFVYDYPAGAH